MVTNVYGFQLRGIEIVDQAEALKSFRICSKLCNNNSTKEVKGQEDHKGA